MGIIQHGRHHNYIMHELQILHYYTTSNVNNHKPESLKTQADDKLNCLKYYCGRQSH